MSMRTRLNWRNQAILATALAALGLAAFYLEFKRKPAKESAEEQNKKVFSLKERQIKTLAMIDPKGAQASFEFECLDFAGKLCKPGDSSKWQLVAPQKFKADDSNASNLVSTFNNLTASEMIDLKDETATKRAALLKDYGLDVSERQGKQSRKVRITTDGGTFTAHFGAIHPIGDSHFALVEKDGIVDENRVLVVPTYFKSQFEHDLTYWRDKKILTLASNDVAGFELISTTKGTKSALAAERRDAGWVLHSGNEEYSGDIENIDNLLSAVGYLAAKSFTTQASLKGTKPALVIRLKKAKEAPSASETIVTLHSSNQKTGAKPAAKSSKTDSASSSAKLYATVAGLDPVFELDPYTLDRLNKNLKDLRLTKLITSMDRFGARKLEWTGKPLGATPLVLTSKDGKWNVNVSGADTGEANTDKITQLLDKLSGNRIREFLVGSAIPAGEADGVTLKLSDEKGAVKRHVVFWRVGKDVSAKLHARDLLSTRQEVFGIDLALAGDLPWDRDVLVKKPTPANNTPTNTGAKPDTAKP